MFGKLTWDAIPFHEPIAMATSLVVLLVVAAVAIWVWRKGWWPQLWHDYITSTDHKKIGIMYIVLGLVMLVRQHAAELGPRGICVNGVAPTVVRTEMGAHWLKNPKTRAWLKERIPLGRIAEPDEVAQAVLFFCSPAADYITGQILYVDGGLTASQ